MMRLKLWIQLPSCRTDFTLTTTYRITKPLTFADCVGDELPLGWEEVYDQQVGVYYIDHINSELFSTSHPQIFIRVRLLISF